MNNNLPEAKKLDFEVPVTLNSFDKSIDDTDRLPDDVLKNNLRKKAQRYLVNARSFNYRNFELEVKNVDGRIDKKVPSMLMVPPYAEKFFEGAFIENVDASVAKYIFTKNIGFCDYFSALVIILRDNRGDVVDIIKYRPTRDGYDLPKYLQEKAENKPMKRGNDFLYPFQVEMERLIEKKEYSFIGEGLKNSVNALIRSIPYVSIEGVANAANKQIAEYINGLYHRGIRIYGAMDGDSAGKKAFDTMNELLNRPIINLIDFDSGKDFTDYLREEKI